MASELVGRARVLLEADTRGFNRDLRGAEEHARRTGRVLKAGLAVGIGAGVAGFYALGQAARSGFQEFSEGQRAAAQTGAVLKSTGRAANVTARDVDKLAQALLRKTGVDDEVIQGGENVLLTFRGIRNEAGKNNDIFSQATKLTLDLSVALGKDMSSSAIQVGKALQDPVRGVTALRRVGVAFTESQQAQIKTLVESGRTMQAQKLILGELRAEFGGSAEAAGKTFSGQLNVARETLRNLEGEMVAAAIPTLTKLLQAFTGFLPTLQRWGRAFGQSVGPVISLIVQRFGPVVRYLGRLVQETFQRIAAVVRKHGDDIRQIIQNLGTIIQNLWVVAGPILKLLFEQVLPRVIAVAIVALKLLTTEWKVVTNAIRSLVGIILGVLDKFLGGIQAVVEGAGHLPFVGKKFDGIADAIGRARDKVRDLQDEIDHAHGKNIKVNVDIGFTSLGKRLRGDGMVGASFGQALQTGAQRFAQAHADDLAPRPSSPFPVGPVRGGNAGLWKRPDVTPGLWDELAIARADHLAITSTYRPGAITSTGNRSLHGIYPAHAFDAAGSEGSMRVFFSQMIGRPGLSEVIHSPYWWHPGSGTTRIPASAGTVLRDHFSHVHVGTQTGDGKVGLRGDGRAGARRRRKPPPRRVVKRVLSHPPRRSAVAAAKKLSAAQKRRAAAAAFAKRDLATMPPGEQLALLTAQTYTPADPSDDLAVLRREKARLERWLRDPRATTAQRISLLEALQSVNQQIEGLAPTDAGTTDTGGFDTGGGFTDTLATAQEDAAANALAQAQAAAASRVGFLQGAYDLRGFASNVLGSAFSGSTALGAAAGLRGGTVTVQNFYQGPPQDAMSWTKQLEFELKAVVG